MSAYECNFEWATTSYLSYCVFDTAPNLGDPPRVPVCGPLCETEGSVDRSSSCADPRSRRDAFVDRAGAAFGTADAAHERALALADAAADGQESASRARKGRKLSFPHTRARLVCAYRATCVARERERERGKSHVARDLPERFSNSL